MLLVYFLFSFIFFFKQKTAYEMRISDWSSDVCSSDLNRCDRRFVMCTCTRSHKRGSATAQCKLHAKYRRARANDRRSGSRLSEYPCDRRIKPELGRKAVEGPGKSSCLPYCGTRRGRARIEADLPASRLRETA